ncbi:MAG: peptide chain release factor 1 [Verrucomicrobia bacterium]|nr:peptide chain release factor 1 [Verrucomicrobiota bacterium]
MDIQAQVERLQKRHDEVERELSDPRVFGDQRRAAELSREHRKLRQLFEFHAELQKVERELRENEAMAADEKADAELRAMAAQEIEPLKARQQKLLFEIQSIIVPADPNDSRNTIIEIRAGAGGQEAALFAANLYRMYSRYAEARGWKVETMDISPSDLGGLKEVIFSVTGEDVFRRLRYESGVHRVQRVPVTEASGRIHTSTATVAVLPEAEEVDVEIKPEELDITVCRASGPGGQGVNTTDSAVQIIHKPTGMLVRCADERSQLKNKAKALRVLRSRLLQHRQEEEAAKYAAQRKSQVGTGERNERIRTYNFPQNRCTDHRINLTLHNLPAIMEGALEPVIEALMAQALEERLKNAA